MNKIAVTSHSRIYQLFIRDEADASVAAEIFKEKEYRVADELIKNAKFPILDIGAHTGMFSLYARSLNPEVRIVAVEPEKRNLVYLRDHVIKNDIKNIEIIEGALAGESEKRTLDISVDSHNHKLAILGQKSKNNNVVVDALSLSDLRKKCIINDISLIKLDIEGGEHEVFESLEKEELERLHCIIMEYHDYHGDIEMKLRENGFGVRIFPSRFDKKMGFLFALNKRITYGA